MSRRPPSNDPVAAALRQAARLRFWRRVGEALLVVLLFAGCVAIAWGL